MTLRAGCRASAAVLAALLSFTASAADLFDFGLATSGARIDAVAVAARSADAPTVLVIGGLHGEDETTAAVRRAVSDFERLRARDRDVNLLAVPLANPDGAPLEFPPSGVAYREHSESHALWRWIGTQAPDLVLVADSADFGLAAALGEHAAADMGRIPARRWSGPEELRALRAARVPKSDARRELESRRLRTPRQVADELAMRYGRDFDQPWYIAAVALLAQLELGHLDDVRRLAEPYVDGTKDSLAQPNSLVMAGHIVFTELARRTGDARYVAAVRKVADLGFDASGAMKESMPYHNEFSDSVFMGTVIAAQAGALTGERKYFDMADRHLRFMEALDLRPDGLYRHQPATDAAWGRGNGFAAIGLALTLSELPRDHEGYAHALSSYRSLMAALAPQQNRDGLWRNVVDHPGAYAELSATAMIGFAMLRGLRSGWLAGDDYERAVERAWIAVSSRSSAAGTFIDVCESTARMTSLEQYLRRTAILGEDPRAGAMVMLFATELGKPRAAPR
ncbi:MAG TPA: glycoside hydrolase family 88 protein [Gammaproteobacteria bacterium]|nr:glycoside hydrolase family 88 protein [Gammaproteobacteria bacterium]